jgi:predicted nuclease with TOPRIM domain
MPTTDPVKRRKQNCENQKRWRQRQVDTLERLTTALDESETRSKQLETESGDLRDALRKAQDEIKQLRAANQNLVLQVRIHPRGKVSSSVYSERVGAGDPGSIPAAPARGDIWCRTVRTTSIAMPSEEGMPLTNIWRVWIDRGHF